MTTREIYLGSDGEATKDLYRRLEEKGPAGHVAVNLFRSQKSSARAKVYRGRGYKGLAYDKKNWSMSNLCDILVKHAAELGIDWGWKIDPAQEYHNWVLYVDTPLGQASFHAASRGKGPDYLGEWKREHKSEDSVINYADFVLIGGDVALAARQDADAKFGISFGVDVGQPGGDLSALTVIRSDRKSDTVVQTCLWDKESNMPSTYRKGEPLPAAMQSWPWCAICNTAVDLVVIEKDPATRQELITVHHHGETDSVLVDSIDLHDQRCSIGGRAFERKGLTA